MKYYKINKDGFKDIISSSLFKGMVIYSFGTLGSKAINFAIYPILTFFLIKSELGYYDLIINSIYLVIPIATFQVSDGIFRAILPLNDVSQIKKIISSGISLIFGTALTIISLIGIVLHFFTNVEYIFIVILMSILYAINLSFKQVVRGLKYNKSYVISDIIYSFFFVISLLLLLIFFNLKLKAVLISFIVANFISLIYLVSSTNLYIYLKIVVPDKKTSLWLFKYSIPLIPNTLSWWLVGSANSWIITIILNLEANGIYGLAFKFSSIIYLFNQIFSLAWQDQLIGKQEEDKEYNSKVFNRLVFFLLMIVLFIIILMKPILRLIVNESYFIAWKFIPFLLFATIFSSISSYFGAFYLKWKQTNKIFKTTLIGAIITVAFSFILTHFIGLIGATISMFIGFFVVSFLRYQDTKKQLTLRLNPNLIILIILIILAILLSYYI